MFLNTFPLYNLISGKLFFEFLHKHMSFIYSNIPVTRNRPNRDFHHPAIDHHCRILRKTEIYFSYFAMKRNVATILRNFTPIFW